MSDLERIVRLRALATRLAKDADRAEGVTEAVRRRLKKEFGITNDRDLEVKLSEVLAEKADLERQLGPMLDDFERDHGDKL